MRGAAKMLTGPTGAGRSTSCLDCGRSHDRAASDGTVVIMAIDITFDFRNDASGGDPDASSPTLLRYHHLLWSKPLPSGMDFHLTPQSQHPYALLHDSDLGLFRLTSDSVLPTFTRRRDMQAIIGQLPPADIDAFNTITYTIGGMILWPGNRIDGRWTINQARGCTGRIADRFDLTIECVRRHYEGDDTHPLGDVLARYRAFFDLFGSFAGYVDFWLLDDLLDAEGCVKFFLASDDFSLPAIPRSRADYHVFRDRTIEFVTARNRRISQLAL